MSQSVTLDENEVSDASTVTGALYSILVLQPGEL